MTFTWDATDLSTDLAKVRSNTGDIVSSDPYLTDEQISAVIAATNSVDQATVNCIRQILGLLARRIDRSGAKFSSTRSQLFQHYRDLLVEYEAKSASLAGPSWSEHSEDDAEDIESDSDFIQPAFKIGRDDNP